MQYIIPIDNTANQEFSNNINEVDMLINIKEKDGFMLFNLRINGEYVCTDTICFANHQLLPYKYMQKECGCNFFFVTENDNTPYYTDFNNTCFLYAITEDELNG